MTQAVSPPGNPGTYGLNRDSGGAGTAASTSVAHSAVNYSASGANVDAHLAGIDTALEVPTTPANYTPTAATINGHLAGLDTAVGAVAVLAANDEYSATKAVNGADVRALQALSASNRNSATLAGDVVLLTDSSQALGKYQQDLDPDGADRYVSAHASGTGVLRAHVIRNTGSIGEELVIRGPGGTPVLGTCYAEKYGLLVDWAGDGTWTWYGGGEVEQDKWTFDPKAVCDGSINRLALLRVDASAPNGIYLLGWSLTFLQNPYTEVDLDLKRADDLIGVANAAVMDVLDTTAGASAETAAANINGGAVVATGQDVYLEFGADYTLAGEQCIFTLRYLRR